MSIQIRDIQLKFDKSKMLPLQMTAEIPITIVSIRLSNTEEFSKLTDDGIITSIHSGGQQYGGAKYHFIILESGALYKCRPYNFKPVIYPYVESSTNDSLCIGVAGNLNERDLLSNQKESCINLITWMVDNFNLKIRNDLIKTFYNESRVDIKSLLDNVTSRWVDVNTSRRIAGELVRTTDDEDLTPSVWYLTARTTTPKITSISDLCVFLNIGKDSDAYKELLSMNPHIKDIDHIDPGTIIYYKPTPNSRIDEISGRQQVLLRNILDKASLALEAVTAGKVQIFDKDKIKDNVKYPYGISQKDSDNNVSKTTMYAGRPEPSFLRDMQLPGYKYTSLSIKRSKATSSNIKYKYTDIEIPFLMSPSSFSDSRQNGAQIIKTNGATFISRQGKQPINLSLTGHMVDVKKQLERHEFLNLMKEYIEDRKNEYFEYVNDFNVKLSVEGRVYEGILMNISFTKSAVQPFMYQYNLNFVALNDTYVYDTKKALIQAENKIGLILVASPNEDERAPVFLTDAMYHDLTKK